MEYWITQTGDKLAIKDMKTSHIENCIKMLERKLEEKPEPVADASDSDDAYFAQLSVDNTNDAIEEDIKEVINRFNDELAFRKTGLKPPNRMIQVCPNCNKIDVYANDGHACDAEWEAQRQEDQEYYD